MGKPPIQADFKYIASELSCPHLAARLGNYFMLPDLDKLFSVIDHQWGLDQAQFKTEEDFDDYYFYLDKLKDKISLVYNDINKRVELEKLLYTFGESLKFSKLIDYDKLTPLDDLINEAEIRLAIEEQKSRLKKGQLLNCFDVFPAGYFKANENGMFMSCKTATLIRQTFGFTRYSVPNLADIGFIFSNKFSEIYLIINLETKEKYISRRSNTVEDVNAKSRVTKDTFKNHGQFVEKRTMGSICKRILYKEIVGIDEDKHKLVITEMNKLNMLRVSLAHSKVHKEHKTHVHKEHKTHVHKKHKTHVHTNKHKPHNYPVKNFITCADGRQLTAKEYAIEFRVSLVTAYKKAKAI